MDICKGEINAVGTYDSYLNNNLQSFPYYDEKTKSVKYHPSVIFIDGVMHFHKNGKLHSYNDEPAIITPAGSKCYYKEGFLHREGNKPAVIEVNGDVEYRINGELHREGDEPAVIKCDAKRMEYYKNGKLHRDGDKPAVIRCDGEEYYQNGLPHRDGDKPAVINTDGSWHHRKHGKVHRDGDSPAVMEADGSVYYYKDNKFHREGDKPAVIKANGDTEYWINGEKYTPQQKVIVCTPEQKDKNIVVKCSPSLIVKNKEITINETEVEDLILFVMVFKDLHNDAKKRLIDEIFLNANIVLTIDKIKLVRDSKKIKESDKEHILYFVSKTNHKE